MTCRSRGWERPEGVCGARHSQALKARHTLARGVSPGKPRPSPGAPKGRHSDPPHVPRFQRSVGMTAFPFPGLTPRAIL
jgi:hypothetical protein